MTGKIQTSLKNFRGNFCWTFVEIFFVEIFVLLSGFIVSSGTLYCADLSQRDTELTKFASWPICITLVPEALTRRERQQKEKPEARRRTSGLGRWEFHFHVIDLASMPTYREPIRIVVISCPRSRLGMSLRSQSETRFKIWTKYRHGSEILNSRDQRPFSSLRVFAFAVSLFRVRASGTRVDLRTGV